MGAALEPVDAGDAGNRRHAITRDDHGITTSAQHNFGEIIEHIAGVRIGKLSVKEPPREAIHATGHNPVGRLKHPEQWLQMKRVADQRERRDNPLELVHFEKVRM